MNNHTQTNTETNTLGAAALYALADLARWRAARADHEAGDLAVASFVQYAAAEYSRSQSKEAVASVMAGALTLLTMTTRAESEGQTT